MGEWVATAERLPEPRQRVMARLGRKSRVRRLLYVAAGKWADERGRIMPDFAAPTHWRPLSEPTP